MAIKEGLNSKHHPEINTITTAARAGPGTKRHRTTPSSLEAPTLLSLRWHHRCMPPALSYQHATRLIPHVHRYHPARPAASNLRESFHTRSPFMSLQLCMCPSKCGSLEFAVLAYAFAFYVRPLFLTDSSPWIILQGWANLAALPVLSRCISVFISACPFATRTSVGEQLNDMRIHVFIGGFEHAV